MKKTSTIIKNIPVTDIFFHSYTLYPSLSLRLYFVMIGFMKQGTFFKNCLDNFIFSSFTKFTRKITKVYLFRNFEGNLSQFEHGFPFFCKFYNQIKYIFGKLSLHLSLNYSENQPSHLYFLQP